VESPRNSYGPVRPDGPRPETILAAETKSFGGSHNLGCRTRVVDNPVPGRRSDGSMTEARYSRRRSRTRDMIVGVVSQTTTT
jgi:hypothetical protein